LLIVIAHASAIPTPNEESTLRKRLEDGHPKNSARESYEEQQLMFLIVAAAIERGPCTIFPNCHYRF
jgi:hypothetical protein